MGSRRRSPSLAGGAKASSIKLATKPQHCLSPNLRITGSIRAPYRESSFADKRPMSGQVSVPRRSTNGISAQADAVFLRKGVINCAERMPVLNLSAGRYVRRTSSASILRIAFNISAPLAENVPCLRKRPESPDGT